MIKYISVWSQVSDLENGVDYSAIHYWENEHTSLERFKRRWSSVLDGQFMMQSVYPETHIQEI